MKLAPENLVDPKTIPAPPNLLRSFSSGFDAISNHLSLALFPIVLDLFLWWGPRLRIETFVKGMLADTLLSPELQAADTQDMLSASRDLWIEIASRFNLLTIMRTYPVGVSSLMAGISPVEAPSMTGPVWQAPNMLGILGWIFGLGLLGLALGTLFYTGVSQAVLTTGVTWVQVIREWPKKYLQVVALALLWLAVIIGVSLPFSCILTLLALLGIGFGPLTVLLYGSALVWVLLPLAFSAHGIFVNGLSMWPSLKDGFWLTRLTLPSTSLFLLVVILLGQGLNQIWSLPAETSWMGLVGIAGHGFVTTGLLAASFVYYRDANRWVQQVFQKTQSA